MAVDPRFDLVPWQMLLASIVLIPTALVAAVATLGLGEPLTLPIVAAIVLILGGVAIGTTGSRVWA